MILVTRLAKTADATDAEIKFGEDNPMIWSENTKTADLVQHTARGLCTLNLILKDDDSN